MTPLNPAQIEAMIDTLDHADRSQPDVWLKPLLDLQERLGKAQRVRRWVGAPALGMALLLPGLTGSHDVLTWVGLSWLIGAAALMIAQLVLERFFPILDREARIQALGNYFLPWRDDDEEVESEHAAT
jgi:hypothetical protein